MSQGWHQIIAFIDFILWQIISYDEKILYSWVKANFGQLETNVFMQWLLILILFLSFNKAKKKFNPGNKSIYVYTPLNSLIIISMYVVNFPNCIE